MTQTRREKTSPAIDNMLDSLSRLQAENAALKAANSELKKALFQAQQRIAELESQATAPKGEPPPKQFKGIHKL